MADDSFIKGTSQDSFSDRLNLVVEQVNELNRAASKAGSAVHELGDEYDYTNAQLKEFIKLQKQANRVSRSGFSTTSSQHTSSNSSSKESKGNKEEKKQSTRIEQLYKKMPSWLSKSLGSLDDKAGKGLDLAKLLNLGEVSKTATTLSKSSKLFAGTSAGVLAGTAAVSAFVAGIAVLTKITLDARDSTESYSRSLTQMGVTLNDLEQASIDSRNSLNDLSNKWGNAMQDLGEAFEPILTTIIDFLDKATDFVGMDDSESKENVYGVQAGIVSSAKQSGFSLQTSQALAGNTYREALKISEKYGQQASDIAEKLAEAWLTGSDAAKEYGVVVNDDVLTGFMASQGVDIANTEITDAMEQYYRFLLMSYELQQGNTEELQNQIKEWTQLGFMIDKAKGKLFSFDEVIQLTSADSKIPDMSGGLFEVNGGGDGGDGGVNIPPVIITPPNNTPEPDIGTVTETKPELVIEPVFEPAIEVVLERAMELIEDFSTGTITVSVVVAALDALKDLQELLDKLFGGAKELAYSVLVSVLGEDAVEALAGALEDLGWAFDLLPQPIPVTVSVLGALALAELLSTLKELGKYLNKDNELSFELAFSTVNQELFDVLVAGAATVVVTATLGALSPSMETLLDIFGAAQPKKEVEIYPYVTPSQQELLDIFPVADTPVTVTAMLAIAYAANSITAEAIGDLVDNLGVLNGAAISFSLAAILAEGMSTAVDYISLLAPYVGVASIISFALSITGATTLLDVYNAMVNMPSAVATSVTATADGEEDVLSLYNTVKELDGSIFRVTLSTLVPGASLVFAVQDAIESVANNWAANLDIEVTGNELLEKSQSLLSSIQAILMSLGMPVAMPSVGDITDAATAGVGKLVDMVPKDTVDSIKGAIGDVFGTVKDKASGALSGAASSIVAGAGGLWGAINNTESMRDDSSTSFFVSGLNEVFGEGTFDETDLIPNLLADLDRQSVMFPWGFRDQTVTGVTSEEIWGDIKDDYLGQNAVGDLSLGQTSVAGIVSLLTLLSGTGAFKGAASAAGSTASSAGSSLLGWLGKLVNAGSGALNGVGGVAAMGFADGGIGTKEISNATLFEGDKKEAVIPLESTRGIQYLANAMQMAGLSANNQGYGEITINLTLSGINIAEDEARWNQVAEKIGERIDVLRQQRGELSYGTNY